MAVYSFVFSQHLWDICGQIVGSGTRRADPDKMAAVEAIKAPETKKQVRQTMDFSTTSRRVFPILLP